MYSVNIMAFSVFIYLFYLTDDLNFELYMALFVLT